MPTIKTRAEYDALPALNYSGSKVLISKNPAAYKAYIDAPREETKALRIGSLTHALVLEPEVVSSRFAMLPDDIDRRTKAGKEAFEAFTLGAAGKSVVPAEDWGICANVAVSMVKAIAALGLNITATELMLTVDYCGVRLKSAIDAIATDKNGDEWIIDLKTTGDEASPKAFLNTARSYRYPLQSHFYRTVYQAETGKRVRGFIFIVTEKEPPFLSASYQIGPELMTYAAMDFEQAVAAYKGCTALDEWPGYPSEVVEIDIPSKTAATPISFA
jgi:hypothetical protein